jgi:hypothetical protein
VRRAVVLLPLALAALAALPAPAAPLDVVERGFLCQSGRVGALPGFYVQALAQNSWTQGQVDLLGQLYGPNAPRVTAQRGQPGISWNRRTCRQTSTRIPLQQGPLRAAYRDTAKCILGGAILVRVRVVRQGGRLVEARLAVAMQNKRRAMAYAVALRNGDARLFTRPACDP